jgi:hypothetical protein
MLRFGMRQIPFDETAPGFEPIAAVSRDVAAELIRRGVDFTDEIEYDEPGPARFAVIELDDGTQLLLVHHVGHSDAFLELRGHASDVPPGMVMARFLHSLDLMPEVYSVSDKWSAISR